ncbi:hypothetical protein BD413DRAFT_492272 [Trametes elegans]|nr:hypothetical protein BD413DRAFT_492272 [Trametes elegans]
MAAMTRTVHPLWSIVEVVHEVVKANAYATATLAHNALVLRAFSKPASHELLDFFSTIWVLRGPIKDVEWARARHYARMVRAFESVGSDKLDGFATISLLDKTQMAPLCPRLQSLRWLNSFDDCAVLALFKSHILRSVSLNLHCLGPPLEGLDHPTAFEYTNGAALRTLAAWDPRIYTIEYETGAFPCALGPLLAFEDLHVRIGTHEETPFSVATKDVEDIATAWPKVHTLEIPFFQDEPSPAFPATALVHLAEKCRDLKLLILPLPHHAPLSQIRVSKLPKYKNRVEDLRLFGGSWPEETQNAGRKYLKRLFPRAESPMFVEDLSTDEDI